MQHLRSRPVCRDALKEGSARCRQLHLAIVSRKQFDPDFALEPPNLMTEVWLRYPKPGGGSSEVEFLGDRDKELQMSIFHALNDMQNV